MQWQVFTIISAANLITCDVFHLQLKKQFNILSFIATNLSSE